MGDNALVCYIDQHEEGTMDESPRAMAQRMLDSLDTLEQQLRDVQGMYKTATSRADFNSDFQDLFAAHQSVAAVVDFIDSVPQWKRDGFGLCVRASTDGTQKHR